MGSGITSGECQAQDVVNISEEMVSDWLYTPGDTIIITTITPILLCLGAITNALFLFVVFRVPAMKSDTNLYLTNLALANLLYLSLAATYDIWSYVASPVAFHIPFVNSAQCVSFILITNTGYFASIALVTTVSLERYLALCYPMRHRAICGRGRTYRMVVVCWLVGLTFSGLTVPHKATLNVQCLPWPDTAIYNELPSAKALCDTMQSWVQFYAEPLLNIPWITAMLANIYMYVHIIQVLNERRNIQSGMDEHHHQALQIRNQVAKMLIVNGVVFFICQTPYRVVSLSRWISSLAQIPDPISAALGNTAQWISFIPEYMNGMVNPLIYGMMNSQYRAAFLEAFRLRGPASQNSSITSSPVTKITTCAQKL